MSDIPSNSPPAENFISDEEDGQDYQMFVPNLGQLSFNGRQITHPDNMSSTLLGVQEVPAPVRPTPCHFVGTQQAESAGSVVACNNLHCSICYPTMCCGCHCICCCPVCVCPYCHYY